MADYGLIKFRGPNGRNYSVRGSVTHNPVNVSSEAVVNLDGTIDRTFTPQGYRASMSLANRDTDGNPTPIAELMALDNVDFTFLHDSERMDRFYGRAKLTGDPSVDDTTGELSGINVVAQNFLEVPR